MSFLIQYLVQALAWLWNVISSLPLHCLSLLLQGLAAFINWLPAPGFFANAGGWIGNVPPLAAFLLSSLQIGSLVTILVSAYTLRFVIRRIPFLG
jgi:hypothetical protein